MASVATPTVVKQWNDGHGIWVNGTISVSSAAYVNNGIPCSFAGLVVGSQQPPTFCNIWGVAGFVYAYTNVAATQAGGLFLIFVEATVSTNTPLAQHSTATVVSGVTGDTINFLAYFPFGR